MTLAITIACQQAIEARFRVYPGEIMERTFGKGGLSKNKELCSARRWLALMLRMWTEKSYPEIAKCCGYSSHGSVITPVRDLARDCLAGTENTRILVQLCRSVRHNLGIGAPRAKFWDEVRGEESGHR